MQNFPTPPVREDTQVSVYILYTHFFSFSEPNKPVSSKTFVVPLWQSSRLTRESVLKTRNRNFKLSSQNQAQ